jgi:beta-glucosidase
VGNDNVLSKREKVSYDFPSGKLVETWALNLKDTAASNYFPGNKCTVEYRESIYVGYRYYEKAEETARNDGGYD